MIEQNREILFERFPHLALLSLSCSAEPYQQESLPPLDLDSSDALYIYGTGGGLPYEQIRPWLQNDASRKVIFLEDHVQRFLSLPNPAILLDPQVHVSLCDVEALARQFPCRKIAVVALPSYRGASFRRMRLKLLRKTAISFALHLDRIRAEVPFRNFTQNVRFIPKSFYANKLKGSFQGVGAIVCGAGPSLSIEELRPLQDKALFIAGGSAIVALSSQGILPHFGVAVDPNDEEYDRLKNAAQNIPLLYSTRVCPQVCSTWAGPLGYMRSGSGGILELWMEEALGLADPLLEAFASPEAISVTSLCIAWAHFLGCSPILLNGLDLAYTNGRRYAAGVLSDNPIPTDTTGDQFTLRKGRNGKRVRTALRWVMESASISHFAKHHASARFIDTTEEGLGFQHIERLALPNAAQFLPHAAGLRARVDEAIQSSPMPQSSAQIIEQKMSELQQSLQRILLHLHILTGKQKGSTALAELELQEEMAYPYLFYDIDTLFPEKKWENMLSLVERYL